MGKKFKFSIILSIYNVEKYLEEAIESLINQTIGFEDNVQLILVNDGSPDNSEEICLFYEQKYPQNIKTITKKNGGVSSARNCGLKYATGEYINFLDPDDILSKNTLKHVYNFFKKHDKEIDFVAMPIIMFGRKDGPHLLNYKFEKERVIDVTEDYTPIQLSAASAFFKQEAIKRYRFKDGLARGEDHLSINKLLLEKKKFGVVNNVTYWYRQRYDNTSMLGSAKQKESYYTPHIRDCLLDLIYHCLETESYVPKFIQYTTIYDFRWLIEEKEFPDYFTEEDKKQFWDVTYKFLSYIDDDIINEHFLLPQNLKSFLLYLKNKKEFKVNIKKNEVTIHTGNNQIAKLNNHKLWFDIITLKDGFLNISATFESICDIKNIQIEAIKNELVNHKKQTFIGKFFEYPNRKPKCFLLNKWIYTYTAEFKIPIDSNEITKINFRINILENNTIAHMKGHIHFSRPCKLNKINHYYIENNQIVTYEGNSIYCKPYSFKRLVKHELNSILTILKERPNTYISGILFRIARSLYYPFMKNKKIWLFSDRPDMADDNGKHLFKYAIEQDDDIEKFYVIDKKCPDYKKMLKINKNILHLGSFKHKIYFSYAEKIITAFLNEDYSNPFSKNFRLYSCYYTFKFYFLQHGVIKDDLSLNIKKYDKDISLLLTSSDFEKKSIINGNYNYNEHIVQILGLPRFDNLSNANKKKTILFMPTWRDFIQNETDLINSDYYHLITSLLNNKKLIKSMKKQGYTLIFRPHPLLLNYLKDEIFDIDDEVLISIDDPYQELFNTASLLITDYSSVFFDFAYLKKPIIYYQVNEESYHYEKGYFDYETMGFGEVTHNEEELVDKICENMYNGCINDEKYIKRVEKFFKYTDKNNCKRVYNWILEN